MIARLARKLGFEPSVPIGVVDDWIMAPPSEITPIAPRGGTATALIDTFGRIQPADRRWTLDWTLAAGARWVAALDSERISQRLVGPATIETTIDTPSGPIVQRVASAVVDSEPVALVEIENQGSVAIAAGIVARPLVHHGRGYLGTASVSPTGIDLADQGAIHFEQAVATSVADGVDLLANMPAADAGATPANIGSKAGGAQAAAVFPVPHTATVRLVVELGGPIASSAAVPAIADVDRGWRLHLEAGMGIKVGETPLDDRISAAARSLLTSWPSPTMTPAAVTALSELGFADDAVRLLNELDRVEDDHALLAGVARWAQLANPQTHLDTLDRIIGPVAQAAHAASAGGPMRGPAWLTGALVALSQRLEAIDQPDVAQRVRSLRVDGHSAEPPAVSDLVDGPRHRLKPSTFADLGAASRLVLGARGGLLGDRADGADVLGALPVEWRGRSIEALRAPVEGGTISFGVRWHGPRPALLWQVDREGGPFKITAAAIDPDFSTTEQSGEALLADPGWPRK